MKNLLLITLTSLIALQVFAGGEKEAKIEKKNDSSTIESAIQETEKSDELDYNFDEIEPFDAQVDSDDEETSLDNSED